MTNDVRLRASTAAPATRHHRLTPASSGNAIPIVYQGQQFPNRAALARHLAPLVGKTRSHRPARSVEALLINYNNDVEAVLLARPYRQRPRSVAGARAG